MTASCSEPLILDEMFASVIARTLRERGYDVMSIAEQPDLRGRSDADLLSWAIENGRRIVTENVRDFRPLARAGSVGGAAMLFTSSRSFPRSRRNPGPLTDALTAWLAGSYGAARPPEDWLVRPET